MDTLVSIIMPCFNASRTISSSIRSIKAQTFKDFECFIIDDKSSDNSLSLISDLTNLDKRFKIIKFS